MTSLDGVQCLVARVKYVDDRGVAYLKLASGVVIPYKLDVGEDLTANQTVVYSPEENRAEPAPSSLWPRDNWIATVRKVLDDELVVETDGQLKTIPRPSEPELEVGNVVEVSDVDAVRRKLADRPLPRYDVSSGEQFDVGRLRFKPTGKLSYDDFGGYPEIKARTNELIEVPLKFYEELRTIRARAIKGVLFTGDAGTGKTLMGRIIAERAEATFYKISGPEIISKWVGSSEEVLREIFEDARKNQPAIIFFDEIDSIAPRRADESHEASRRLVAQLLTLMDGFDKDNVVIIATTNRPQDIDDALRRPGRFDWQIHFPYPEKSDRQAILATTARTHNVSDDLPHEMIAGKTAGWSPAELVAIWSDAALLAVAEGRDRMNAEDYYGGYERVARQRELVLATRRDVDKENA